MYKVTVTLFNSNSPLEENVFYTPISKEIEVSNYDHQEVFDKIESFITSMRQGHERTEIGIIVTKEGGGRIIEGSVKDGFHGIVMS